MVGGTRLLSIDGGGIKGIFPLYILTELENNTKRPITDFFDHFAGTSIGSIIIAGLNVPSEKNRYSPKYSARDILGKFILIIRAMFPRSIIGRMGKAIKGTITSKYSTKEFGKKIRELFGTTKLTETVKPVYITAVSITNGIISPVIFSTENAHRNKLYNISLADAVIASCSAPTFLNPHEIIHEDHDPEYYIDGSLSFHSPALIASMIVMSLKEMSTRKLKVISLGTGFYLYPDKKTMKTGGTIAWSGEFIAEIMFMAQINSINKQTSLYIKQIGGLFTRVDTILSKHIKMDDSCRTNIEYLQKMGRRWIEEHPEKFAEMINLHPRITMSEHEIPSTMFAPAPMIGAKDISKKGLAKRAKELKKLTRRRSSADFMAIRRERKKDIHISSSRRRRITDSRETTVIDMLVPILDIDLITAKRIKKVSKFIFAKKKVDPLPIEESVLVIEEEKAASAGIMSFIKRIPRGSRVAVSDDDDDEPASSTDGTPFDEEEITTFRGTDDDYIPGSTSRLTRRKSNKSLFIVKETPRLNPGGEHLYDY